MQECNSFICDMLNSVLYNIADATGKEQASLLKWMRFSIDVMSSLNGSDKQVKERTEIIFPVQMLLDNLKTAYNIDSHSDKSETKKSILKKHSQFPPEVRVVTFTPDFQYNDKEGGSVDNGSSIKQKPEQPEDASFGNITFMDNRGEYFANFFSDI